LRTSLVNRSKDEFGSVKNQLRTMRKKLEGIRVDHSELAHLGDEKNLIYFHHSSFKGIFCKSLGPRRSAIGGDI
jgi:hypothetical protein